MDAISLTTFSSAFSWIKMFEFRLTFHWSLFLRVQLTIFRHWFRNWHGAVQATSHYPNQCWLVYRRICASLGFNELTPTSEYMYQKIKFDKARLIHGLHRTFVSKYKCKRDHRLNALGSSKSKSLSQYASVCRTTRMLNTFGGDLLTKTVISWTHQVGI